MRFRNLPTIYWQVIGIQNCINIYKQHEAFQEIILKTKTKRKKRGAH